MRTSTKLAIGLLGGGNLRYRYIYQDLFTTTRAGGAVIGTAAEPGPGNRGGTDTASKLSIASGRLVFAGNNNLADPMYLMPAVERKAGLTFEARLVCSGDQGPLFGFRKANSAGWGMNGGFRLGSGSVLIPLDDGTASAAVDTVSNAYDQLYRVVLKAAGYICYISKNGGLTWTQVYENNTETYSPLYPMAYNFNNNPRFDYIAIYEGTTPSWAGIFTDDFDRANTAPATTALGTSPQGMWWQGSGSNLPFISGGAMACSDTLGTSYGLLDFPEGVLPHTVRATIEWNATAGAGQEGVAVLIGGTNPLTDMVHPIFFRDHYSLTAWQGGVSTEVGSGNYAQCALDTGYPIGIRVNGNTVTVECPDGQTFTHSHAMVGQYWGRKIIYELTHSPGYGPKPKFHDVTVLW